MSGHTPGPWVVLGSAFVDAAEDYAIGVRFEGGRQIIAEAFGRHDWETALPSKANARLIAAAPELLEALLVAHSHLEMHKLDISHATDAALIRAAIAKATGASHD